MWFNNTRLLLLKHSLSAGWRNINIFKPARTKSFKCLRQMFVCLGQPKNLISLERHGSALGSPPGGHAQNTSAGFFIRGGGGESSSENLIQAKCGQKSHKDGSRKLGWHVTLSINVAYIKYVNETGITGCFQRKTSLKVWLCSLHSSLYCNG